MVSTIKKFYDTNILLSHLEELDKEETFFISSVTLRELEGIKTSHTKSDDVKYAARCAVRWLNENEGKYTVVVYEDCMRTACIDTVEDLEETNDLKIMLCAKWMDSVGTDSIVFCTNDLLCKIIAKEYLGLNVCDLEENTDDSYKGYIEISLSEEEMADFYSDLSVNRYGLLTNQYIIVKDENGNPVDNLKWNGKEYQTVRCKPYKSSMFGTLKPLDNIQSFAMDSISTNEITVLYGKAGSGKTTIPLNYIMQEIEKGRYKKCYVIYSYEPLKGAKVLGFEKGSHEDKILLSASIGNILASKFGDLEQVRYMLDRGILEIIPTANIRGIEIPSDSICFCTESQNLDVYTLKTIIQRCKSGCKQIYEGDIIEQKDTNITNIGMNRLIEVFKGNESFGCVKLKNNYRSELSELADLL